MVRKPTLGHEMVPLSAEKRIDKVCTPFEQAWCLRRRPQIEPYLRDAPGAERIALFRELLMLELDYRRQYDERPSLEEYELRFPDYTDVIAEAFRAERAGDTPSFESDTVGQPRAKGSAADLHTTGGRIGRYAVQQQLGRGGCGTVYLAWDGDLQRKVAIKVPIRDRFASERAVDIFVSESRTAAQLQHPGIVPVYDVARQEDGTPYVVMKYIDGSSLEQLLDSKKLAYERSAEIVMHVAEAIGYAHADGFVHRDMKPANILLDGKGRPYVADFGLAIHESNQRRRAGEYAGTLPYMAPEQVRREAHRLDGRADIWSLGIILYEMLTGRRPFDGDSQEELVDEILHREPKPPRQIDQAIPAPLERIVLKCCAKKLTDRYTTASDVANDLRDYLADSGPGTVRFLAQLRTKPLQFLARMRLRQATYLVAATFGLAVLAMALFQIGNRGAQGDMQPTGDAHARPALSSAGDRVLVSYDTFDDERIDLNKWNVKGSVEEVDRRLQVWLFRDFQPEGGSFSTEGKPGASNIHGFRLGFSRSGQTKSFGSKARINFELTNGEDWIRVGGLHNQTFFIGSGGAYGTNRVAVSDPTDTIPDGPFEIRERNGNIEVLHNGEVKMTLDNQSIQAGSFFKFEAQGNPAGRQNHREVAQFGTYIADIEFYVSRPPAPAAIASE